MDDVRFVCKSKVNAKVLNIFDALERRFGWEGKSLQVWNVLVPWLKGHTLMMIHVYGHGRLL